MTLVKAKDDLEFEEALKTAITPAKPKEKPVKRSVRISRRENRAVGELSISEEFWHLVGKVWRAHWRGILFVLVNNGVWAYRIFVK